MYADFSAADFFQASKPKDLKADNQNSYFSMKELEDIYALARPYLRTGFLVPGNLNNSFAQDPKQAFISLNYAPTELKPPRLAFLIVKTISDDKVPDYTAQFNIRTEQGWLQTTRMRDINLPVVLAGVRGCIYTHWFVPKADISLIPG